MTVTQLATRHHELAKQRSLALCAVSDVATFTRGALLHVVVRVSLYFPQICDATSIDVFRILWVTVLGLVFVELP